MEGNVGIMILYLILLSSFAPCMGHLYNTKHPKAVNSRPVIGILTQTTSNNFSVPYGTSYMYSSIVHWVRSGGALVVPVRVNQSEAYYHKLMDKINGVIWPGGHAHINDSGFATAAKIMFDYAKKLNDDGKYFPIWGVCLGFESLVMFVEGRQLQEPCEAHDLNIPLVLGPDYEKSAHLNLMPDDIKALMTTGNYADHFHVQCILTDMFYNSSLKDFFHLSSTNVDLNGTKFVSSIEGKKYPFYGLAFHPEKFNYIWQPDIHPIHSLESVRISQYFANFFVTEARKSTAHFPSDDDLFNRIISNYRHVWIGSEFVEYFEFYDNEFVE